MMILPFSSLKPSGRFHLPWSFFASTSFSWSESFGVYPTTTLSLSADGVIVTSPFLSAATAGSDGLVSTTLNLTLTSFSLPSGKVTVIVFSTSPTWSNLGFAFSSFHEYFVCSGKSFAFLT